MLPKYSIVNEPDSETKKLKTGYRSLYPKINVDKLYVIRKKGEIKMMSIPECLRIEGCSLSSNMKRIEINRSTILSNFVKDRSAVELKNGKL